MKTYEVTYIKRTYDGQGEPIEFERTETFRTKGELTRWIERNRYEVLAVYEVTRKLVDL